MLRIINIAIYSIKLYAPHYAIAFFFCRMLLYAFFLLIEGYDKWWLGLVPGGHYYAKRELGAITWLLIVPCALIEVVTLIIPNVVTAFLWWLLAAIINWKFAKAYVNNYPVAIYGFVPFGIFIYIVREIILWKNSIREKSTTSTD